jgi:uncharacterized membrane protein
VSTSIRWASPYSIGLILALAFLALAIFGLLRWASGRPIAPARRWGLLVVRLFILAALGVVLLNPVQVDEMPGSVEQPQVFYLVDTSQSMTLGKGTSRWDQAVKTIRDADRPGDPKTSAQLGVFRFGSRLAAVEGPFWRPPAPSPKPTGAGLAIAAEPQRPSAPPPAPTDDETLLGSSLEALTGRFGQTPPQAVVLFSDGSARDADRAATIARAYGKMKIPVHVVPLGDSQVGGDVAIVSLVAPDRVRKNTRVSAQVFVRSFGYKGKRAELKLVTAGHEGKAASLLARTPIVLQDGMNSYTLAFDSGDADRRVEAIIDPQPGEASSANNRFGTEMAIDHTKVRVLYLEGATDQFQVKKTSLGQGGIEMVGAYYSLQQALMEDPDIECTAVMPAGASGDFSSFVRSDERWRGLPESRSELFAYDAIILSNVPRDALSDPHLAWVDEWIGRRGGGLCMLGGPHAFASGGWSDTSVGKMLPLELAPSGRDWTDGSIKLVPGDASAHPIWHIAADEARNRSILKALPGFLGSNHLGAVKAGAEVLATVGETAVPALAVQAYGRGRTMAMSPAITRRYAPDFTQKWGENDARYYQKLWRNVIDWLTENSSIGRRRLLAETDKRLYRPGEPIVIHARTFDENAAQTLEYRVAVSVEPKSSENVTSDDSPLRKPSTSDPDAAGALLPWGEEFEMARKKADQSYFASLPIAEAKSLSAGVTLTQGLRIELTAYENNTQVDSTALEVQVIDDPSEQQNPLPDHDLMRTIADRSGGAVLKDSNDLAAMIGLLPRLVGPSEIRTAPVWSTWWLLATLLGLLTVEWVWRRRFGLA